MTAIHHASVPYRSMSATNDEVLGKRKRHCDNGSQEKTPLETVNELAAAAIAASNFRALCPPLNAIYELFCQKKPETCIYLNDSVIHAMHGKVGEVTTKHDCPDMRYECSRLKDQMLFIQQLNAHSIMQLTKNADAAHLKMKLSANLQSTQAKKVDRLMREAEAAMKEAMAMYHHSVALREEAELQMKIAQSIQKCLELEDKEGKKLIETARSIESLRADNLVHRVDNQCLQTFSDEEDRCFKDVISTLERQIAEDTEMSEKNLCPLRQMGMHHQLAKSSSEWHGSIPQAGIKRYLLNYELISASLARDLAHLALHRQNPLAMALCYMYGLYGFEQHRKRAGEILTMFLRLNKDCLVTNFVMYQFNKGCAASVAFGHLQKAASGGLACAQVEMSLHDNFSSTPVLQKEWLDKAKANGHPYAWRYDAMRAHDKIDFNNLTEECQQLARDTCFPAMKRAYEAGDVFFASFWLAVYYKHGFGVLFDLHAAARHFLEAANVVGVEGKGWVCGNPAAMYEYAMVRLGELDEYDDDELAAELTMEKEGAECMLRAQRMRYPAAVQYVDREWYNMVVSTKQCGNEAFHSRYSVALPSDFSTAVQKADCMSCLFGYSNRC